MPRYLAVQLLLLLSSTVLPLKAHDVLWWENDEGDAPEEPMVFRTRYLFDTVHYIGIVPSEDEPCTVMVNVNPPASEYVSVRVLPPNPENEVEIAVTLVKFPMSTILTSVTGEWHATGFPLLSDCTALLPNPFTVPILILAPGNPWRVGRSLDGHSVTLANDGKIGLQGSMSLSGPWLTMGLGSNFTLHADLGVQYFRGIERLGGSVGGTVTDPSGKPQAGVTVTLPYGGPTNNSASDGSFVLRMLPWGDKVLQFLKSASFVDPNTGQPRTDQAGLEVIVPSSTNLFPKLALKMDVQIVPVPGCNCTPWCAIGFGSLNGGQTPVYYAGGVNVPKNAPAKCDVPQVTVTTPIGSTFQIQPGSGWHQNSGADPASGVWTVTTTACGQSKSCTVTVP